MHLSPPLQSVLEVQRESIGVSEPQPPTTSTRKQAASAAPATDLARTDER